MTSISKNVYIKLDDIVGEYSSTCYGTIKIKPAYVKSGTCIDLDVENDDKDPKFEVDDSAKTSKYKNVFPKDYFPNWAEEIFDIKKVNNTVPWTYVIKRLNDEEIAWTFYKKKCKRKSNRA